MRFLIFLFVFVLSLEQAIWAACPNILESRKLYFNGEFQKSIEGLKCLVKEDPKNLEALRFLSDIYWWENQPEESLSYAEKAYKESEQHKELYYHLYNRLSRFSLSGFYQNIFARNSTNYEIDTQLSYRYFNKNKIYGRFQRQVRLFDSSPKLVDEIYEIGHSHVWSKEFYFLTNLAYSPDPVVAAEWKVELEPHYVWRGFVDLYLRYKSGFYEDTHANSLKPGVLCDINDILSVGFGSELLLTPDLAFSVEESIFIRPHFRWLLKVSAAGGQSYEGDGLIDTFLSTSASVRYQPARFLYLNILGNIHRGELREENRIGAGAEFIF